MLGATLIRKIFGSRNQRILKKINKIVIKINELEGSLQSLTDGELAAKTTEFKTRLKAGSTLDQLLPEAFAVVREAAKRTLGLRHFDVQLIGGIVLHQGKISEMGTGEGKTLMATLAAYLNALAGKGVHVVTVNDYLAERDANWMRPVYELLGFKVGIILADMDHTARQKAYLADITYGTNNEFGFDYLRDNMAFDSAHRVQRGLYFAIVDEVDSILIDEARTPLIISGPTEGSADMYIKINQLIPKLTLRETEDGPGDFYLEEKSKQAFLTEEGHEKIEQLLTEAGLIEADESLYDAKNISLVHHINACLRAHHLYHKDVDYIVADNAVVIVDEHTGRTMPGRRWSDGLHQAAEAKENVPVQNENQTLASITFQNYFKLYSRLSGMTGTADTEAFEFHQIYGLEVVVIPTNRPCVRKDDSDLVFLKMQDKFLAIIEDVKDCYKRKQPVLLGTASIEASEVLSRLLKQAGLKHHLLNAKFHAKEAKIIADAGRPGAITIATNMAGRGTDIVLGGNLDMEIAELAHPTEDKISEVKAAWQKRHDQVIAAGGLRVIGSERHEARRIDNQLRGRSGRQGDAGASRFYLSLEDNLLRIFAADRMMGLMQRVGMKEGEPLESRMLTRVIENAQRKVEGHYFDMRKQLLEFDNVANDQRHVIYEQRNELLDAEDVSETIQAILPDVCNAFIDTYIPPHSFEDMWDIKGLEQGLLGEFDIRLDISHLLEDTQVNEENIREKVLQKFEENYALKEKTVEAEILRQLEKSIMLQVLDKHWREHLSAMDYLRQGIHLRGYAQKNPKQEYKRESFTLFSQMLDDIKHEVISLLWRAQIQAQQDVDALEAQRLERSQSMLELQHSSGVGGELEDFSPAMPTRREQPKVGRNDPCPCGSSKKYKQCHGRLQ